MAFFTGLSERDVRSQRARWLTVFAFFAIGMCWLRLADLQLIRGRALTQASENNHTQVLVERAPRGRILDRNGDVLADDQPVFVALFSPLGIDPVDFKQSLTKLSQILGVDPSELDRRLMAAVHAKSMMRISDRLQREQAFEILQEQTHLPGISLTIEEQRYYPRETLASHVLGYVGQITDEELDQFADQGYHSGDWIGKSGLERLYDPSLHGQDGGFLIEVDARGRQVRVLRHLLPLAGKDLVLTMDAKLQALAEQRLKESEHPGAAVVMNPKTGEILALASAPGFNPNFFLPLGNSDERKKLLEDPDTPLYNRAIQALYPPGSTFKIITTLAALEEHSLDASETVYCKGSVTLGTRVFRCWKPHGHGTVDFLKAMAQSCDVYFYQLGAAIGPDPIEQMAKLFGLGQLTGVDLPHEKRWPLPMAWKASRQRSADRHWQGGDTYNYAIGQGALQVTPLQMANLISTVANEGSLWQPYIVAESRRFGEAPQRLGISHMQSHLAIPQASWDLLKESLVGVVHGGTGASAQIDGIEVAGKTGTAQATKGKEHGWFVSYAPADDPRVACSIVIEHGGHGGTVAAPIAHDLMAMALGMGTSQLGIEHVYTEGD